MKLSPENLETLQAVSSVLDVRQVTCKTPNEMMPLLGDVKVLYTFEFPFDPAEVAPQLKWIQLDSAGVDHLLGSPVMKSPVTITNTSGIHSIPMAEYVMGMMLALVKKLPKTMEYQRRREWPSKRAYVLLSEELSDKTMGIVGYGSIGREVARLAKAFGMHVLAIKRRIETKTDEGYGLPEVGDPEGTLVGRIYPMGNLRDTLTLCNIGMGGSGTLISEINCLLVSSKQTNFSANKRRLQCLCPSSGGLRARAIK